MKDPNIIEAEVLTILASPTEQEMLARMRAYIEGLQSDELEYAQKFTASRRAAMERAKAPLPNPLPSSGGFFRLNI